MAYEGSVPYRAGTAGDACPGPAQPAARCPAIPAHPRRGSGPAPRSAPAPARLPAACSGPVRLDRGSVGLLYETGDFSAYSTITFRRIPVEELV